MRRVYGQAVKRWDVEPPSDQLDETTKLPDQGLQLREEYVLYAHFQLLRRWLSRFDKAHFFVDQGGGIRAAFMAAVGGWVCADRSHLSIRRSKKRPHARSASAKRSSARPVRGGVASIVARSSYWRPPSKSIRSNRDHGMIAGRLTPGAPRARWTSASPTRPAV